MSLDETFLHVCILTTGDYHIVEFVHCSPKRSSGNVCRNIETDVFLLYSWHLNMYLCITCGAFKGIKQRVPCIL
ncbi:unnamed protein product [Schistosoma rodhaini]|uniref:Uncharacterized protein n=1 Tax=Schistosoma rodhaini TaxID=6188 RepID=A0AA85GJU4_9TREM|nr:unnamed protein product [Schistosoma rodhaini]